MRSSASIGSPYLSVGLMPYSVSGSCRIARRLGLGLVRGPGWLGGPGRGDEGGLVGAEHGVAGVLHVAGTYNGHLVGGESGSLRASLGERSMQRSQGLVTTRSRRWRGGCVGLG